MGNGTHGTVEQTKFRDLTQDLHAPKSESSPASVIDSYRIIAVFRDDDGHLLELSTENNYLGDLTNVSGATAASGDPSTYLPATTGLPVVLHRGKDGGVHDIFYIPGSAGRETLSADAQSPQAAEWAIPVGYSLADDMTHVIYADSDGDLHLLYWQGPQAVGYDHQPLNELAGSSKAGGNPCAYYDSANRENSVVYKGKHDDRLHRIYWETGSYQYRSEILSATGSNEPGAAGTPSGFYHPNTQRHYVIYRTDGGAICELSWKNGEPRLLRTPFAEMFNPPTVGSDPVAYFSGNDPSINHVVYVDQSGHVCKTAWWAGSASIPWSDDFTVGLGAPPAIGNPSAFYVEPNSHHIFYRAPNKHIYQIMYLESEVPF